MSITYIFGNGFDIQCGARSRYSDFLKEYTAIQADDDDNIRAFKKYLSESTSQELWSDAERAMGIYLEEFSDENMEEYTKRIVDLQIKMMEYLEKEQDKCNRYTWERRDRIGDIFSDFIYGSHEDVISLRKPELFDLMRRNNSYSFITFNYTDLIDNVVHSRFTDEIHHVHGKLEDLIIMGVNDVGQLHTGAGMTLTDELKKQLIKPELSGIVDHRWDAPAMDIIKRSNAIVIYGVSFGETDNIWWEKIRKWLEAYPDHKLIVFVRDRKKRNSSNCRLIWQIEEYENEKSVEVLEKLGYKNDHPKYKQLLRQIYTIPNTTRLDLKPIILNDSFKGSDLDKVALSGTASAAEMV